MRQRRAWLAGQLDLDPTRLVFIDETWASTNMARKRGRCRRGRRLRAAVPHGHYKTVTLVAGLRLCGLAAQKGLRPADQRGLVRGMGGKMSRAHPLERRHRRHGQPVEPQGTQGRATHKGGRSRTAISAVLQPRHEPDRKGLFQAEAFLLKIAERTVAGLLIALDACADIFQPAECTNYFKARGYDTG